MRYKKPIQRNGFERISKQVIQLKKRFVASCIDFVSEKMRNGFEMKGFLNK